MNSDEWDELTQKLRDAWGAELAALNRISGHLAAAKQAGKWSRLPGSYIQAVQEAAHEAQQIEQRLINATARMLG